MMREKKESKIQTLAKGAIESSWKELWLYKKENRLWLKKSADIAMRVLDILEEREMTQIELAQRLGVSRQQVSKIVKGQENLTLETIAKLEEVLGLELVLTNFETKKTKSASSSSKKEKSETRTQRM